MGGKDETQALILSGGGAYGAYEVGVMKALFNGASPATGNMPLNAGVFTGTSVGALNAAFMVSQPGVESASTVIDLEDIWVNEISESSRKCGNGIYRFRGNPLKYLEPECIAMSPAEPFVSLAEDTGFFTRYLFSRGANFLFSSGNLPQRSLQLIDLSAFISTEPLKRSIRSIVRFDDIRGSDHVLRLAATSWHTGMVRIFENRDMTDELGPQILQASAAVPAVFPPVEIEGELYIDGGVVNNTPLKTAIRTGATNLHVIYLDPDVRRIPVRRFQNTLDTFMKTFSIMLATIANEDIDHANEINLGLRAIERAARGETSFAIDPGAFVRVASLIEKQLNLGLPYKKLTIHRYRPHDELGGALGMLNFNQEVIRQMVERGFTDALNHDCQASHCVLPDASSGQVDAKNH